MCDYLSISFVVILFYCCIVVRERCALPKLLWEDLFSLSYDLRYGDLSEINVVDGWMDNATYRSSRQHYT